MTPRSVGEWLSGLPGELTVTALYDLLLWAMVAVVVAVLVRYARRWVDREIEEVNKRHRIRKIVYVTVADSGVQVTLRYLSHIRRVRGAADRVAREMLEAVEADPRLDFAYPTWRVYHRGEASDGAPENDETASLDERGERA